MPVIRDIPLKLKTSEVLRRQGFRGYAKARTEIKSVVLELLESGSQLLEPKIAYEIYAVTVMSHDRVSLEGNATVHGTLLPANFPEAKELAIAVCTIGGRLERQVTEYSQGGETLRGMLLDGIGSAAVDALVQEACRIIEEDAASKGHQASSPVAPGMPGLELKEQWNFLELAHADSIGVSLTSSGVMVPRKSTSMAIGIGAAMGTWTKAEVCGRCNLRETCAYSVHA